MVLAALWFRDKKPVPNLFLKPLLDPLRKPYNGIEFQVEDIEDILKVQSVIICGTGDLRAKALFLLLNIFNARFECMVCIIEGITLDRTRTYPYFAKLILRTEENVNE